MAPPPPDHACAWFDEAERLRARVAELEDKIGGLEHNLEQTIRRFIGKKSEKLRPDAVQKEPDETRAERRRKAREEAKKTRQRNAEERAKLPTEIVPHLVPAEQRVCPKCGRTHLRSVGDGRATFEFVLVLERIIRRIHQQETLSCPCGEYIVTAPPPDRVFDKARYSPTLIANLIVSKCADAIPLHRLQKRFRRLGLPLTRSTMNDLLHRAAELLRPLYERQLAIIAAEDLVYADECSMRLLDRHDGRNGYVWTFIAKKNDRTLIAYVFSANRSGDTPEKVLGGTRGRLIVDAFTGYNVVTDVDGRERGGCHAHLRRKFYDALSTAPESMEAIELIRELYLVEHEARREGIAGTPAHLELRKKKSAPIRERLHAWLLAQRERHPPKSPIGTAIRYGLKNWNSFGLFLTDARIALDNNISERALRIVVLGRKNYLFVVTKEAGENLAGLYSLIASCEANGVNPLEYLADVLLRIQTHPASRIDELLPQNWGASAPPPAPPAPTGPGPRPSPPAPTTSPQEPATPTPPPPRPASPAQTKVAPTKPKATKPVAPAKPPPQLAALAPTAPAPLTARPPTVAVPRRKSVRPQKATKALSQSDPPGSETPPSLSVTAVADAAAPVRAADPPRALEKPARRTSRSAGVESPTRSRGPRQPRDGP